MTALPAWMYRSPEDICDGLIARSNRQAQPEPKPQPARKDDYYRQSRSIEIKNMVKRAKRGDFK
jgi:hypothetical protein